jgi:hypothetical protein
MKRLLSVALFALGAASFAMALPPPPSAPEIDAGSAASALTLLSGAVLMFRSRRKV